jgi:glycosyltransferase 2 family protein
LKKSFLFFLKTILPLVFGIYLIWYFFNEMSQESYDYFKKALNKANYFWIVLALLLSFLAYLSRAYRWKHMLESLGYKTSFWNRYHAMMIGYLVNLTIPRAGEATRAAMLYRSDEVPFSKSFGTIIAERAIDLIMLLFVTLITFSFAYSDFETIFFQIKTQFNNSNSENGQLIKIIVFLLGGIGFLSILFLFLFDKKIKLKIINFVKGIISGLLSIFYTKKVFHFIAHTLFIWVLYILYFGIAFLSLEETSNFPIEGIFMGFIAGALGISFTNGGIGTFPLLVALVVVFYLGDENPNALAIGNAIGMLIWVSQTVFLIILGLISLILLPKNFDKEKINHV